VKNVPKYLIVFAVAAVLIIGVGAGGWYWVADQAATAAQERESLEDELGRVARQGIPPFKENLTVLQDNTAKIDKALAGALPAFEKTAAVFDEVTLPGGDGKPRIGLASDKWKQIMIKKKEALKEAADSNKVALPDDFFFGFKLYKDRNPPEPLTFKLGVELVGIEALSKVLITSGVSEIKSIKRSTDMAMMAGSAASSGEETMGTSPLPGPEGLYDAYPLEVTFRCRTAQLRKIMNKIRGDDVLFITRFLVAQNEVQAVRKKSEVQASLNTAPAAEGEEEAPAKLLVTVVGDEQLTVRLRVDVIYWKQQAAPAVAAKEVAP
jgi:hypothetical protein